MLEIKQKGQEITGGLLGMLCMFLPLKGGSADSQKCVISASNCFEGRSEPSREFEPKMSLSSSSNYSIQRPVVSFADTISLPLKGY